MAIPWISVLQIVPWKDVINNAPKVADGAKKLWDAMGKKSPSPATDASDERSTVSPEATTINSLKAQLATIESSVANLQEQMRVSSELIKSLADQNTQLIKRIELNRVRVVWLAGIIVIISIFATSCLILMPTQ